MRFLQSWFEHLLWSSRLLVLVAVVTSAASALAMTLVTTRDAWSFISHVPAYLTHAGDAVARAQERSGMLAEVVEVVDGYLLSTFLVLFSLGLYELFIDRIVWLEGSEFSERVLVVRTLDDLKDRLAKVILLMLVVSFFQKALRIPHTQPMELLYLAAGMLMVGGALYLANRSSSKAKPPTP